MKEKDIILNTKIPNTVSSISTDLRNLGIKQGDVLLVHSSLSSIGWVSGGAQGVILALLDAVGYDGTLVMPTHSGDWSDPVKWENPPVPQEWIEIIYKSLPAFDKDMTPTRGMGQIPELFRKFSNTIRSNHPQVSFAANGKLAKEVTENHKLTPQFGLDTPIGKLYNLNAKVLLLGVNYESCSSFHLSEVLSNTIEHCKMGTAINEDGKRVWKWFEDYDYDSEDFSLIGEYLESKNLITKGKVGNAETFLFDLKTCVNEATLWLNHNR